MLLSKEQSDYFLIKYVSGKGGRVVYIVYICRGHVWLFKLCKMGQENKYLPTFLKILTVLMGFVLVTHITCMGQVLNLFEQVLVCVHSDT